jgi:hypothetical protein
MKYNSDSKTVVPLSLLPPPPHRLMTTKPVYTGKARFIYFRCSLGKLQEIHILTAPSVSNRPYHTEGRNKTAQGGRPYQSEGRMKSAIGTLSCKKVSAKLYARL